MAETRNCRHCGTPFSAEGDGEFCCSGCAHVHDLINSAGLDRFYSLRDRAIEPVSPAVARPADLGWLESLAADAEKEAGGGTGTARLDLDLKGISCVGCVWLIEELFQRKPGAIRLEIRPQTGAATLRWRPGVFSPTAFAAEIRRFGYRLAPAASGNHRGDSGPLLARLGICAFLALNTMLFTLPGYLGMARDFPFAGTFEILALLFATLSYGVGGLWFVGRAWDAARMGVLHIDLPIALGVSVAWAGSVAGWLIGYEPLVYFDFVAIFLFLMLAGRWLQERSIDRNRARVRALDPSAATYADAETGEAKPVGTLRPGHRFRVAPGATVPVLAVLESGTTAVSLESINGEAEPVVLATGARVPSGAINAGSAEALVRAEEAWTDSLLHRLVSSKAEAGRNPVLERVLAVYTAAIIALALLGGTAWAVFGGILPALQVAVSILVVSCPCSLGIAWPLVNDLAAGRLRRHGLYLRHIEIWGRLPRVRDIIFDKTGTLTLEIPRLRDPAAVDQLEATARAVLLGLVESSFHPFGRALREALIGQGVQPATLESFEEVPGEGLAARFGGERWTLGKAGWQDGGVPDGGGSVFARNGKEIGRFHFEDEVRAGAAAELDWLQRQGFRIAVLSGDHPEKVGRLAGSLGIAPERALGAMDPVAKADWIDRHAPGRALMIGDGANDALAFARAVCRGTPLLDKGILESRSDFFFTGRDLSALRHLFETARIRSRTLLRVFGFAVLYNGAAVGVCLAGWMNPLLAAVLMPASALITLGIASRTSRSR